MTAVDVPVVTIDGPGGVGKGTLCHRLSGRLGFHLLDSGALYRLVGLAARRAGVDLADAPSVSRVAEELDVSFVSGDASEPVRPMLAGEDVTAAIRTEACGQDASVVARIDAVRVALLARQRAFRRPPGLVADGRDMGTVVFPDATVKLFLEASARERARRRHKQLIEKGISVSLRDLLAEIEDRDRRDRERPVAPLVPAPEAVVLDTTGLGIREVERMAMDRIRAAGIGMAEEPTR